MHILRVRAIKSLLKFELIGQGYSKEQAQDIVDNEVGENRIIAWLKKWGPMILDILMIVLPLVMSNSSHIPLGVRTSAPIVVHNSTLPSSQEIWDTTE